MKRLCFLIGLLVAPALPAAEIPLAERQSSYAIMAPETRAMQDDDTANPGMFWVLDGEALWSRKAGETQKSCADCHGDAPAAMRGVSARYPAFDAARARAVNIEQRVNLCRVEHQRAPALGYESKELLALTAYVARQSRGMPIEVNIDGPARKHFEAGQEFFFRRRGQINLSCAQCHDANWGRTLYAERISQGHPNAYPAYRLEWQTLGSLQRRFRSCLSGVRAEMLPYGAPQYLDLELSSNHNLRRTS